MFRFIMACENGITKKMLAKCNAQAIPFFKVSQVPKQCTGIFTVSNAWTNLWNKKMEGKARVEKQNSVKGFDKNEHTCSVEGVFVVLDWTAHPYFKVACPLQPNSENSKIV